MATIFNSVKGLHPKRNAFSAFTYRNDFTAPLGVNLPVYFQEVPPATKVLLSTNALIRLQALISPVMDNIDYYVHYWKIPYRLLENDRFTQFISGEIEAADYDALFCTPQELGEAVIERINVVTSAPALKLQLYDDIFGNGSLLDFIGYDKGLFPTVKLGGSGNATLIVDVPGHSAMDFNWRGLIAYFMLHTNWYMNENVPYFDQFVELVEDLVKNQSLESLVKLLVATAYLNLDYGCSFLPHGWEKDYFTSALPNVQFGTPVSLPLGGTAPVAVNTEADSYSLDGSFTLQTAKTVENISPDMGAAIDRYLNGNLGTVVENGTSPSGYDFESEGLIFDSSLGGFDLKAEDVNGNPISLLQADLSEASAISINEFRFANALQVFKERQMRFGRRRQEYYKGFFDVSPEDLRLQVPKYLGGGRIPINIADIEQTSATSDSSVLGRLAGKATAVAGGFAGFRTFCSEESVIIGIAFAMPHITYGQSVSRFKFKTNNIYDYFNPSFEHLGEQAILNVELYASSKNPLGEFGYTPRYNEYRFHNNEMHGAFKDTLSFWTLGRIFNSQPALNAKFVYMQPSVFNRIFAVAGEPPMLVSMLFRVKLVQPISKYGTPMLLA